MLAQLLTVAIITLVPEPKFVEFKDKGKLYIELRAERKEQRSLGAVELGAALKGHVKPPFGDGPAEKAGVVKGDILVKVNGLYVRQMNFKKLLPLFKERPLRLLFAPATGSIRERLCPLRDDSRLCCFEDEKHGTCYPHAKKICMETPGAEWCGYEENDFDL
jgi:hypothetical protein